MSLFLSYSYKLLNRFDNILNKYQLINMPKDKTSIGSKLNAIIRKYPKELEIVSNKLMCKLCLKEISFTHKHGNYNVIKHFETGKHREKKERIEEPTQEFIENSFQKAENHDFKNEFFADLTKSFIEANIPLEKLSHPSLIQFLQKYTKKDIPNPVTLRKHCAKNLSKRYPKSKRCFGRSFNLFNR
jgi:signal recognition particle GTPase